MEVESPYTNAQHYHETGEPKHSNLTEPDGWLCWAVHTFSFVLRMFFLNVILIRPWVKQTNWNQNMPDGSVRLGCASLTLVLYIDIILTYISI